MSGALHQADRELAGFMSSDYALRLREVFRRAEGVLVINPQIAHQVEPYARAVHVIPSGFDRNRFPESLAVPPAADRPRKRIMFAGLIDEYMKGFSVLQEAGERLWQTRQDFEIWVTADERQDSSEFLRYIGWQSQHQLPERIAECDILAFPTFAEEALGRTAVEAMGCGRPVVASRLGGLPWVVEDGRTGLLCEPGDPVDLANKLMQLLDDPILRRTLGTAGREKFLREFTWEQMIAHRYRPLLGDPQTAASPTDSRHSPQLAD